MQSVYLARGRKTSPGKDDADSWYYYSRSHKAKFTGGLLWTGLHQQCSTGDRIQQKCPPRPRWSLRHQSSRGCGTKRSPPQCSARGDKQVWPKLARGEFKPTLATENAVEHWPPLPRRQAVNETNAIRFVDSPSTVRDEMVRVDDRVSSFYTQLNGGEGDTWLPNAHDVAGYFHRHSAIAGKPIKSTWS